jgi:hypothetical protein
MAILKIAKQEQDTEAKERRFTIQQMLKLTTEQRYQMMFEKSKIIKEMMELHGYRQPVKIIKRKEG